MKKKYFLWIVLSLIVVIIASLLLSSSFYVSEGMEPGMETMIKYKMILSTDEKRRKMADELEQTLGQKIERFDAIMGKTVDTNKLSSQYDEHLTFTNTNLKPGQIGCYLSHYMAIKGITETTGFTVIIEDGVTSTDTGIHEKIKEIIHIVNDENPDFDLIFIGHLGKQFGIECDKDINESICSTKKGVIGTQSYVVNNKKRDHILSTITNIDNPIDIKYKILLEEPRITGYLLKNTLLHDADDKSIITQENS